MQLFVVKGGVFVARLGHRHLLGLVMMLLLASSSCQAELPQKQVPCLVNVYLDTLPVVPLLSYDLHHPDWRLELPHVLDEVSGLTIDSAGRQLIAVQDEVGQLFWIDLEQEGVSRQLPFWKEGDYEGVEKVGNRIYVVKSTGTLYEIELRDSVAVTVKYNGFLNSGNDVEGLGYDPVAHQLLLACKASAGVDQAQNPVKAIYAFDLWEKKLLESPRYCIGLQQVNDYLQTHPLLRQLEQLEAFFSPGESTFGFSPSALAVQPQTGHLYILSSVGKILMVIDQSGRILHIEKLKKKVHPQPEGICFDPVGNLYIANEGKKGRGTIQRFNFLNQ